MVNYAWGNMQNGSTGLEALCVAVRGIKLFPDAARAAEAMAVAFEKRFGKRLQFTEGFRPIGRPGDYERGTSNTQWYYWERWLLFRRINGAYPGGSIHGWGKAIDVNLNGLNAEQIEWLHTEARAFGWNWDTTGKVTGEPWHLDFNLPVTAGIIPTEEKDWFDMADENTLKTAIINALGSKEGQDLIKRAVFQNDLSPDATTAFQTAVATALEAPRAQDALAAGTYKNDTSADGKAALKAAVS